MSNIDLKWQMKKKLIVWNGKHDTSSMYSWDVRNKKVGLWKHVPPGTPGIAYLSQGNIPKKNVEDSVMQYHDSCQILFELTLCIFVKQVIHLYTVTSGAIIGLVWPALFSYLQLKSN